MGQGGTPNKAGGARWDIGMNPLSQVLDQLGKPSSVTSIIERQSNKQVPVCSPSILPAEHQRLKQDEQRGTHCLSKMWICMPQAYTWATVHILWAVHLSSCSVAVKEGQLSQAPCANNCPYTYWSVMSIHSSIHHDGPVTLHASKTWIWSCKYVTLCDKLCWVCTAYVWPFLDSSTHCCPSTIMSASNKHTYPPSLNEALKTMDPQLLATLKGVVQVKMDETEQMLLSRDTGSWWGSNKRGRHKRLLCRPGFRS